MRALITLLFLAVVAWNTFIQIMARQQSSISCSYDAATARRMVAQSFGMWWKAGPGRGKTTTRPSGLQSAGAVDQL
jgi:hypothetical protein